MGNKKIARIRRVMFRGEHCMALEAKAGDKWKTVVRDPISCDVQIPLAINFLTNGFMPGVYEIVACDESEHEW